MTGPRAARLAVGSTALLAAAPGIGNGFVYDDLPIILENPLVHRLASAPELWTSGYWPAGLLYRPFAVQLFALEWAIGGGRPIVFHVVSIALAVLTAILFFRLASRVLPPVAALAASVLFAAHPAHVEVVANAVGQTELLATALALFAVERYLVWREDGPLLPARRLALAGVTLLAILSKETGYVIPALLVAAELLVVRAAGRPSRVRDLLPTFALQAAVVLGAILLRIGVLGPTPAAGPSVALRDLAPVERIVGMLAVVPHWIRLLYWPSHLQAEYGPPALAVTDTIHAGHLLGVVILLGAVALVARSWSRAPTLAFGACCAMIALLPVSNLLTATGVILAERTLVLPSAGAMIVLGACVGYLAAAAGRSGPRLRRAVLASVGVLAVAATARSMERSRVWRSSEVFFDRLVIDAPTTYRAQLVASLHYLGAGRLEDAEATARRGLALYKEDPQLFEHLGQILRRQDRCREALPILGEGVQRFPGRTVARSRLIECTLEVGDTAKALALAEEAVTLGHTEFEQTIRRLSPGP